MSNIKITVTEDHLKLVKNLRFSFKDNHLTTQNLDNTKDSPFGYEDVYYEIGLILYGKILDFDPTDTTFVNYTKDVERKEYMDKLLDELPLVLELKCYMDHLTVGVYKRKYHDTVWSKVN